MKIYSYKLRVDTGFAPNPFHGYLTLATCKSTIRATKQVGDWIAGFTSVELNGDDVGKERLVYLMKVTETVTFENYWNNLKYSQKKPNLSSPRHRERVGDNIYKPLRKRAVGSKDFVQQTNIQHECSNIEDDLSGLFVLVSNCFYYFGGNPVCIPDEIRPKVPAGQSASGNHTDGSRAVLLLSHIDSSFEKGIHHSPHTWPDHDQSWRDDQCYVGPTGS